MPKGYSTGQDGWGTGTGPRATLGNQQAGTRGEGSLRGNMGGDLVLDWLDAVCPGPGSWLTMAGSSWVTDGPSRTRSPLHAGAGPPSHRRACSPCHLSSELRVLPGAAPTRQRSTPTPGPGLLPPDLLTSVGAPIPHGVQVPRPLLPPCVLRASGNHLPGLLLTAPSSELPRATSSDSGMRRAPPAPLRPSCHLALSGPRHHDRFGLAPSPPAAPHNPVCTTLPKGPRVACWNDLTAHRRRSGPPRRFS